MSLNKYTTIEELINKLVLQTNSIHMYQLNDYCVSAINNQIATQISDLLKKNILIYDFTPSEFKDNIYERFNFSAFIKRDHVENIANQISQHGYYVGIHDPNSDVGHIYHKGIKSKWKNSKDLITKFEIQFDHNGNPVLHKQEHVWDYGPDQEVLKNILENNAYDKFNKEYVEITVIADTFSKFHNNEILLKQLNDIVKN